MLLNVNIGFGSEEMYPGPISRNPSNVGKAIQAFASCNDAQLYMPLFNSMLEGIL